MYDYDIILDMNELFAGHAKQKKVNNNILTPMTEPDGTLKRRKSF